jgi:hypothetical protein
MIAISRHTILKVSIFKAALLAVAFILSACATVGENILDEAELYSEAASLTPIRFSKKNELRFWRIGWTVNGRVVSEEFLSLYGKYEKTTNQFLISKKKRVQAPKDFIDDLQKLSVLNGVRIDCDSDVLDWPVYLVEGNWQGKNFTFFANIDMCTSDNLKILKKYSGYQEMIEEVKKE